MSLLFNEQNTAFKAVIMLQKSVAVQVPPNLVSSHLFLQYAFWIFCFCLSYFIFTIKQGFFGISPSESQLYKGLVGQNGQGYFGLNRYLTSTPRLVWTYPMHKVAYAIPMEAVHVLSLLFYSNTCWYRYEPKY